MKEKITIYKLFEVMFSNLFTKYLFLIGLVMIMSGVYLYLTNYSYQPKQNNSFNKQFVEVVNQTDNAITNFGDDYLNFLDGGLTPEGYKQSVLILESRFKEVGTVIETMNPTDDQRKLFDKFKSGYTLVYNVIQDNVEYLTAENPDPDLLEKDQERFSVGLNEIHEVTDVLLGKDESI